MSESPTIIHGDCLAELRKMADNSIDAIVTDPPYGLSQTRPDKVADTITRWATGEREYAPGGKGFMGKEWDGFVPPPAVWDECMRILKPGGHLLVFAGTRTQDLMGLSIRLAGFDIRDSLAWVHSQGFPKSMDISKAIDKSAGAQREVIGNYEVTRDLSGGSWADLHGKPNGAVLHDITAPATPEAERWAGWGTALKPAIEPVIVARKPIKGTVAANVLAHGTGGINVDACRVGMSDADREAARVPQPTMRPGGEDSGHALGAGTGRLGATFEPAPAGRWPANVLLDPDAAAAMDEQSGIAPPKKARTGRKGGSNPNPMDWDTAHTDQIGHWPGHNGGGASRFFPVFKYQAKAPAKERPSHTTEDGTEVKHPTVKPLELMRWLIRLVTPPGGIVLDPFAGSGTTLEAALMEGFTPVGIEAESDYIPLIEARLSRVEDTLEATL